MANLALLFFGGIFPDNPGVALFVFLAIGAVTLFGVFLPVAVWTSQRKEERAAFYKAETVRRIAETSGEGAKAVIEMQREEGRIKRLKAREGLKVGGLINIGVGIGLMIFLRTLLGGGNHEAAGSVYLCGLIPGLIGVALLVYVYLLAAPIE